MPGDQAPGSSRAQSSPEALTLLTPTMLHNRIAKSADDMLNKGLAGELSPKVRERLESIVKDVQALNAQLGK